MKPIKYGIKFFLREAKSGYVVDCIIYLGVTSTLQDIVFNLLGRHLQKGYHIFMDFYNSMDLAEGLALYGEITAKPLGAERVNYSEQYFTDHRAVAIVCKCKIQE